MEVEEDGPRTENTTKRIAYPLDLNHGGWLHNSCVRKKILNFSGTMVAAFRATVMTEAQSSSLINITLV
jgi:hypothetical protein